MTLNLLTDAAVMPRSQKSQPQGLAATMALRRGCATSVANSGRLLWLAVHVELYQLRPEDLQYLFEDLFVLRRLQHGQRDQNLQLRIQLQALVDLL